MAKRFEAEVADGLAAMAQIEIEQIIGGQGSIQTQHRSQEIPFTFSGNRRDLMKLKTVLAIYQVLTFTVPRPKALLGHEHFTRLVGTIKDILALHPDVLFQSLYIGAAGSESSVMMRIKQELSTALDLNVAHNEGDLFLRIRPTPKLCDSWDVLIRLTPRPLATRDWRVCNMAGALNASVASVMVRLTNPTPEDTFLNIACGSGTIMIERLAYGNAQHVIGCDMNSDALACARENIEQSKQPAQLLLADGATLPLPDKSVDALCADLPFGQLVGTHEENEWLYPAMMAEAARVARINARFVVITHEIRLMEDTLASLNIWQVQQIHKITLSGLHPRIFVLERKNI